jgi:hypothetical protein
MNGEILLECDGCWENVPTLVARSFHDKWDSGLTIEGDYCRECRELIDSGQVLPNMRACYRRP